MSQWLPGLVGALSLLAIGGLMLLGLYRLCNPKPGQAAQRRYVITESEDVFCAPEGLHSKNEHGHWTPFSDKEAA